MSRIFISYRREDSAGHAGRLYDDLTEALGTDQVFMDIDQLHPGVDWVEVIDEAIQNTGVVLVVIGRSWLDATDAHGERRLENPDDFLLREIATGLERKVRVIPVLVQGASMPKSTSLPDELKPLARRHAIELSDSRWRYDVGRLIEVLHAARSQEVANPSIPATTLPSAPRESAHLPKPTPEHHDPVSSTHTDVPSATESALDQHLKPGARPAPLPPSRTILAPRSLLAVIGGLVVGATTMKSLFDPTYAAFPIVALVVVVLACAWNWTDLPSQYKYRLICATAAAIVIGFLSKPFLPPFGFW